MAGPDFSLFGGAGATRILKSVPLHTNPLYRTVVVLVLTARQVRGSNPSGPFVFATLAPMALARSVTFYINVSKIWGLRIEVMVGV
jgi:hypothetical protein